MEAANAPRAGGGKMSRCSVRFTQATMLFALGAALTACDGWTPTGDPEGSASISSPSVDVSAMEVAPALPKKEQLLIDLTERFSQKWEQAQTANAIVAGQVTDAVNKQFDSEICEFAKFPRVTNWIGTVYDIGLADGDRSKGAYLQLILSSRGDTAVSLSSMLGGDYIRLSSWMTDRGDNDASLLAKQGTPLMDSLSNLKKGDVVVFDGDFQKINGPGCLRTNSNIEEPSDNARASDKQPEYIFNFAKVAKSE